MVSAAGVLAFETAVADQDHKPTASLKDCLHRQQGLIRDLLRYCCMASEDSMSSGAHLPQWPLLRIEGGNQQRLAGVRYRQAFPLHCVDTV